MEPIEDQSISSEDHHDDETLETWLDLLEDKEIEELSDNVAEIMEEYVYGQIAKISDPKFSTIVCDDLTAYFFDIWVDAEICMDSDSDYKEVHRFIGDVYTKYMDEYSILPPRQCDIDTPCIQVDIAPSLERLATIPQPKQKTREWYEKRYGMLTASNISKALGSESQKNSLIYEKCKPLTMDHQYGSVNTENSMHWGVKYEPISAAIYEHMFSAKLSDFGCIPHEKYVFIGASPDGIVTDPAHPRYGHMVEIKNIVNRDITGIPKEEYWIQIQVQLETCNLEYCDFVETRIKEYENAAEYYIDREHNYKGVVLYFVKKMLVAGTLPSWGEEDGRYNVPHYEYMPLDIPISETEQWIYSKKTKLQEEYVLYRTDYWYLENISCVLVQRNREWFNAVVPQFISIWETIEKERVSGYAHRVAVKKPKPLVVVQQSSGDSTGTTRIINGGGGICLIKLDEAGNNISQPSITDLHNLLLL
uniref:YqaJ viral recombinase domain-containing protein n=1 Tax=viral metagenome TaxID=1070528 RepID=A0A6C0JX65_9ZZZZ